MVRSLIRASLLAASLASIWTGPGWCLWGTYGRSDGLSPGFVVSILEDRSGDLWFGTDRNGGDLNDVGGISRFDGVSWHTSETADGGSVTAMLEDRSGNVWVVSERGGVSRFDGVSWRTYTVADGLAPGGASEIIEDHLGNVWVGTSDFYGGGGLSRFDGVGWQTYTAANGLAADNVVSMLEDRSGNLWVGTTYKGRDIPDGGLSRFDGVSWRTYTTADGLAGNAVYSMLEDRTGHLWFGSYDGGVSRFDGVSWRAYTTSDGLAANRVVAILEDRSGNLWFAGSDFTGGGVSSFDGVAWQTYTMADGLVDQGVNSILEDRQGDLWFVTHQGISRFDGTGWRTYKDSDGLADNHVDSILEDRWGNLWFGSRSAVSRFDGVSWRTYNTADGMPSDVTAAVFKDRSGNLWFNSYPGVTRFDGVSWRDYATGDGLVGDDVTTISEDSEGNLWFGTACCGVSRFDGISWRSYTTADGLASNNVRSILQEDSGVLWFGTGDSGVSRFDGVGWRTFTTADGLPPGEVAGMVTDPSGNIWVGTNHTIGNGGGGVGRFDGATWRTYTTADGLAGDIVFSLLVDSSGDLWAGTYGHGVSHFDGTSWRTYTTADGLASNSVYSIAEDRTGKVWFGTLDAGVTSFDGTNWRTYTTSDGLKSNYVGRILEDRSGNLWFGTTRYTPDRASPRTVFLSKPPSVGASRNLSAAFVAAYSESRIEFSYRLDHGAWSSWAPVGNWVGTNLPDGVHTLEARSRDYATNVDSFPPAATFEVDATPPTPLLTSPAFGAILRGAAEVRGSADDTRLQEYRVEVRPAGAALWDPLAHSSRSVSDGPLATWNTSPLADGLYDLRLSASDSLGLTGSAQVTVIVDNHAPFAEVTAPTVVSASTGGKVFTTNAEAQLYFPPHAFAKDALVAVTPALDPNIPAWTLPSGTIHVLAGYDITWGGAPLRKPARLEFSYASRGTGATGASTQNSTARTDAQGVPEASERLAVYRTSEGVWERIGGTTDPSVSRVSLAITAPGIYALFVETGAVSGSETLGALAFTPRVFSPTGSFADGEVGISFTLGRAAPVTVRVYSRSGRLIREVVAGQSMNAGANLVRWDGRDRNGGFAVDGMYLVTVEALGRTERKTLAVVK